LKLFITGSQGTCGSVLQDLPHKKILFDRLGGVSNNKNNQCIKGEIENLDLLKKSMKNCDVLIHLAGADYYPDFSMGEGIGTWSNYKKNNIENLKNLFDLAVKLNVKKIIFSSTHRVMGMYEKENSPDIYSKMSKIKISHTDPVRPDSIYAVSKLFGENYGRLLADAGEIKFISLRICSVREEKMDHPYAYAEYGVKQKKWKRDSPEYNMQVIRLKSLWQSRRDFYQMVNLCIKNNNIDYDIFYGISNNVRSWFDISNAINKIGYKPRDNAENYHNLEMALKK
jgi:NAD+ dependent glucose-6-phosphate dehydrogenase